MSRLSAAAGPGTGGSEPAPQVEVRHRAGDTGPRVLLLHGLASNGNVWEGFCSRVGDRAQLWSAQLPWRDAGVGDWSHRSDQTRWLSAALDAVREEAGGVDVVVAHSYSATLLLSLLGSAEAGDPIDRYGIGALVFVAPFYRPDPTDFGWNTMATLVDRFLLAMEEGIRVAAEGRGNLALHGAMAQKICEQIGPYGWTSFFSLYLSMPWVDTARVKVPVLVVSGTADAIAPPTDSQALVRGLPAGELRPLPGCGHFPMLEQADRFAALLGEFFDRGDLFDRGDFLDRADCLGRGDVLDRFDPNPVPSGVSAVPIQRGV